jgi:hypothetical protein
MDTALPKICHIDSIPFQDYNYDRNSILFLTPDKKRGTMKKTCEIFKTCSYIKKFGNRKDVLKNAWLSCLCHGKGEEECCQRVEFFHENNNPPPDNLTPLGVVK